MDVLDLSLGEKKSRRKTQAPQRRQDRNCNRHLEEKEIVETDGSDVTDDDADSRKNDLIQHDDDNRLKIDLNANKTFLNQGTFSGSHSASDGDNLVVSPYSSNSEVEDKESGRGEQETDKTPSPSGSSNANRTIALTQLPNNYHSKDNRSSSSSNNNNNNNNNNHLKLAQFQQLPSALATNLPNSDREISEISEFRDRFAGLASSMSQSMLRPALKTSSSLPFSSFDVQPIDTPGIPERTKKQNRWAFNVWREWARKRNISVSQTEFLFEKCDF